MRIPFSPRTVSQPATPSTGTELPSWERERLNTKASLWRPGTRPPHASTRAWTLTQATRPCANTGGDERVHDYHWFPGTQSLKPPLHYHPPPPPQPFFPPFPTRINILSHPQTLFSKHKYFTHYYVAYFKIYCMPKLGLIPTQLTKKSTNLFFCHHLKTSRSNWPESS